MSIGILSKRKTMMAGNLKACLENKGFEVSIYTLENLVIDESLLNHEFFILKSNNSSNITMFLRKLFVLVLNI